MSETFLINSFNIGEYQECRRRFLLSEDWWLARWRPKSLFDSCLRAGIFALSQGEDPRKTISEAQYRFMTIAADPGLETVEQPYQLSKDCCGMMATILTYVSKLVQLKLHRPKQVMLTGTTSWEFNSWTDDSGQLHRWMTADGWTDKDLIREMHSWRVMGDLVMSKCPMILHVIETGRLSSGRPATAWVRGYKYPTVPALRMRFESGEGWKPVWFTETSGTAEEWVKLMMAYKIPEKLVHHITINVPAESVCDNAVAQVVAEGMAMREMARDKEGITYDMFPMSRNSCDAYGFPCPYQNVCYVDKPVDIGSLGLYRRREDQRCSTSQQTSR